MLDRRQERSERQHEHIGELSRRAAESEARLERLYGAIEAGVADLNDPALKDRIDGLTAIRDQAKADAERAQAMLENSGNNAVMPRWCAPSPKPRGGISALKGVAIAVTIFAR